MSVSGVNNQSQAMASNDNVSANSSQGLSNEFLNLMIAQIQNQNPLDPTDGTQYVSQLAQLSQVEQLQNLSQQQAAANSLADTMSVLQSADLVGKSVSVPTNTLSLGEEQTIAGKARLNQAASQVNIRITDLAGNDVQTIPLGAQQAGDIAFTSDELPAGNYQLVVEASRNGEVYTSTPYLNRNVEKVSIPSGGGDIRLALDGIGDVSLFDVTEFLGEQI